MVVVGVVLSGTLFGLGAALMATLLGQSPAMIALFYCLGGSGGASMFIALALWRGMIVIDMPDDDG